MPKGGAGGRAILRRPGVGSAGRTEGAAAEAVLITNLRRLGLPALQLPAGFASTRRCPETCLRVDQQEV